MKKREMSKRSAVMEANQITIEDWQAFREGLSFFRWPDMEKIISSKEFKQYILDRITGNASEKSGFAVYPAREAGREKMTYSVVENTEIKFDGNAIIIRLPRIERCVRCGSVYTPKRGNQIYCSRKCAVNASVRRFRARQKEKEAMK